MADATTLPASSLGIEISDAASPETFSAPCGLTTRGLSRTKNTNQTAVPDCDNPDLAPWLTTDPVSRAWSISGSGVLSEEYLEDWEDFFNDDGSRRVRLTIGDPDNGGRQYIGRAHLTQLDYEVPNAGKITVTVTLSGDGPLDLQS